MDTQQSELPADLASASEQLTCWRAEHPPRTRYPSHFWSLAAGLARQYGLRRVCRVLKLDYASLKRRLEPEPAPSLPAFVEIRPGGEASAGCTVECENSRGDRIRIRLEGADLSRLAAFCGQLWSQLR